MSAASNSHSFKEKMSLLQNNRPSCWFGHGHSSRTLGNTGVAGAEYGSINAKASTLQVSRQTWAAGQTSTQAQAQEQAEERDGGIIKRDLS